MKIITNPFSPTPAQAVARNRKWAERCQSNKKKQREQMRGYNGEMCCLAVAEKYAFEVLTAAGKTVSKTDRDDSEPDGWVRDFFGWDSCDPKLLIPNGNKEHAAVLNDGFDGSVKEGLTDNEKYRTKGLSHKQIGECVLNTFCRPKNPKWTFKL